MSEKLRVLIACEYSGRTRRAFQALGHETYSCDILPAEDGERFWHIQEPLRHVFARFKWWDLVIAHPPCTYLCNSGVRWLHERPERWGKLDHAAQFFKMCMAAPADKVAIENPVMHKYGVERVGRKHDFTVQPWQFGDPHKKRTCFWTKGLPPLTPTSDMTASDAKSTVHLASPGPDRWKERSRTYQGIADAMAMQWGGDAREAEESP